VAASYTGLVTWDNESTWYSDSKEKVAGGLQATSGFCCKKISETTPIKCSNSTYLQRPMQRFFQLCFGRLGNLMFRTWVEVDVKGKNKGDWGLGIFILNFMLFLALVGVAFLGLAHKYPQYNLTLPHGQENAQMDSFDKFLALALMMILAFVSLNFLMASKVWGVYTGNAIMFGDITHFVVGKAFMLARVAMSMFGVKARGGYEKNVGFFVIQEMYMIVVGLIWTMCSGIFGVNGNPVSELHASVHFICIVLDGVLKTSVSVLVLKKFNDKTFCLPGCFGVEAIGSGVASIIKPLSAIQKILAASGIHLVFDGVQTAESTFATNIGKCLAKNSGTTALIGYYKRFSASCSFSFLAMCATVLENWFFEGILSPALYGVVSSESLANTFAAKQAKEALVKSLIGRVDRDVNVRSC